MQGAFVQGRWGSVPGILTGCGGVGHAIASPRNEHGMKSGFAPKTKCYSILPVERIDSGDISLRRRRDCKRFLVRIFEQQELRVEREEQLVVEQRERCAKFESMRNA